MFFVPLYLSLHAISAIILTKPSYFVWGTWKWCNETDAIWKIEIKNGKITFYVDNKKIVTTDKTKTGPRYLTTMLDGKYQS